jgi:hypothetical protein
MRRPITGVFPSVLASALRSSCIAFTPSRS